jgi:hypothetical protein
MPHPFRPEHANRTGSNRKDGKDHKEFADCNDRDGSSPAFLFLSSFVVTFRITGSRRRFTGGFQCKRCGRASSYCSPSPPVPLPLRPDGFHRTNHRPTPANRPLEESGSALIPANPFTTAPPNAICHRQECAVRTQVGPESAVSFMPRRLGRGHFPSASRNCEFDASVGRTEARKNSASERRIPLDGPSRQPMIE